MKKLILLVLTAAAFTSCLPMMGSDGQAFIAYSWAVNPIVFYTEDPAFANNSFISNGIYEPAHEGIWYFEYQAWDNSVWYGTYEIYIDEGEMMIDGEDIYFELCCYSTGPHLYAWSEEYRTAGQPPTIFQTQNGHQVLIQGPYRMILEYSRRD